MRQTLVRGQLFRCAFAMAEAMDLGKDPNGPTHSSTLFLREDGSSMSFYVRPSPAKRRLSTLILHGGGTLCRVQEPGAVLLAQPGERPRPEEMVPGSVTRATSCAQTVGFSQK